MGAPRLQPLKSSPPKRPIERPQKRNFPYIGLFLVISMAILSILAMATFEDYVVIDTAGNASLTPERQAALEREYEKLDNSEQYALLASSNGWFPCYNCIGRDSIFLYFGEVWKYGVTKNGQAGRYGSTLPVSNLLYQTQLEGSIELCLKEEKRKIYHYPTLSENLKRLSPLVRPPGNFKDF